MARRARKARTGTPDDISATAGEPIPVGDALNEVIDRAGLITADQLPPVAVAEPPSEPASHAERVRPDGPAKRGPNEPRAVYVSPKGGFRLEQNGPFRRFIFDEKPPEAWIAKLKDAGFHYVPADRAWTAAASYEIRDASDRLALLFDGKDIGQGQAR